MERERVELGLDLANTVVGDSSTRGRDQRGGDLLDSPSGLRSWLEAHGELVGEPGDDVALRVAEFRDLRDAVRGMLEALVAGNPLPLDAVERVNDASASAPIWVQVDATDALKPIVREVGASVGRAVGILAIIARSAIALLGSADRERLRRCPAPRCGRFFLASRRGTVWCGPACGNRARVARHHARGRR